MPKDLEDYKKEGETVSHIKNQKTPVFSSYYGHFDTQNCKLFTQTE